MGFDKIGKQPLITMRSDDLLAMWAHTFTNVDNMDSKGLREISYQGTGKVEAGYKTSNTTETLIGYIVC